VQKYSCEQAYTVVRAFTGLIYIAEHSFTWERLAERAYSNDFRLIKFNDPYNIESNGFYIVRFTDSPHR